LKKEGKNRSH